MEEANLSPESTATSNLNRLRLNKAIFKPEKVADCEIQMRMAVQVQNESITFYRKKLIKGKGLKYYTYPLEKFNQIYLKAKEIIRIKYYWY